MVKLKTDQVGRAGEYFVAAEITRRGGYAVTFSGNMPGIDLLASDAEHERTVTVQIKTKTSGDWQTSIKRGVEWKKDPKDKRYWVLVDLGTPAPTYFVMPAYWIENDILQTYREYIARHGGKRVKNEASTHHSITRKRVEQWRDRWDLLGLWPAE